MNYKKELISILGGILVAYLIYSIIRIYSLNFFQIILFISSIFTLKIFYAIYQKKTNIFKSWIIGIFFIVLIVSMIRITQPFGYMGYFSVILLLVGILIWSRYDQFISAKRDIESMIFGMPIHEFSKKGLKPPKIKLKWR